MREKVSWLLSMAFLLVVLSGIVISRAEHRTDVIFGGNGGRVCAQ